MKTVLLGILGLILLIVISSCSSDDNPTGPTKVTGKAAKVETTDSVYLFDFGEGAVHRHAMSTVIKIKPFKNSGDTTSYVEIYFDGFETGEYNSENDLNKIIINVKGRTYVSSSATLVITKYEDIGKTISGTFSGKFIETNYVTSLTVNTASFTVTRTKHTDEVKIKKDMSMPVIANLNIDFSDGDKYIRSDYTIKGDVEMSGYNNKTLEFNAYYNNSNYVVDEDFKIIARIDIENENSNQTFKIGSESDDNYFELDLYDYLYIIKGQLKIVTFAQKKGDYFEFECTGKIYSVFNPDPLGTIKSFKIKVLRKYN